MSSSTILALKRKALEHKHAGDIETAKQLLSQIRSIESLQDSTDPSDLKKVALILKQNGDIEGAKAALRKSKLLQQQQAVHSAYEATSSSAAAAADAPAHPKILEDPVNRAIDEANLDELTSAKGAVTFTDEEMLDVDTMADMKTAGMGIPTQQEYQARAMAYKRSAVEAKNNNDIEAAKRHLKTCKEFEKAIETLFSSSTLENEDEEEDYSLLDELMGGHENNSNRQDDDGFFQQLFGESSNVVELDDLDDLDPAMLRDMMQAGMEIPNVDEVLENANKKKAAAIAFKKDGNMVAAKAALEESKRLQSKAEQLSDMLKAIQSGACNEEAQNQDPEAMLEAMLEDAEPKTTPTKAETPVALEKLKSSQEYKVQAVQYKKEGRLAEAAAALRLYKQALSAETSAKVNQQRIECIQILQQEGQMAAEQQCNFMYYKKFVDSDLGSAQLAAWNEYAEQCASAVDALKKGGEPMESFKRSSATTSRLKVIPDEHLRFVGKSCDPAEERIEICILEGLDFHTNKRLRKIQQDTARETQGQTTEMPSADSIRVLATVQLPPSVEAPDDNSQLNYDPKSRNAEGTYVFGSSKFVNAERGSSRFGKLLARRMVRKRITFDVFYVAKIKKSFFAKHSTEQTLLGSAVVELKDLLQTNFIAADFPLLDLSRRNELGGRLRIGIRSGGPFGDAKVLEEDSMAATTGLSSTLANIQPYSPFSLSE